MDISKTFVEIARENAKAAGVDVEFRVGNVSDMPYENDSFDFIVCRAAFKNFSDPAGALAEMVRVLRRGGKALIIDMRRDAPKESIERYVMDSGLNWLDSFITKWTFELMLRKRAYLKNEIEDLLSKTRFSKNTIEETGTGMEIWLEK